MDCRFEITAVKKQTSAERLQQKIENIPSSYTHPCFGKDETMLSSNGSITNNTENRKEGTETPKETTQQEFKY